MSGKKQSISNYDGYHLITTLDSFIQFSAERHLSKGISLNDAIKGQVIVMNPQTGAILAMVSYPEMDANQWQKLPPSSRKNACIVDVYEPIEDYRVGKIMDDFLYGFERKKGQEILDYNLSWAKELAKAENASLQKISASAASEAENLGSFSSSSG